MSIYFQQKAVGEISKYRNGTRNKILTKYQLPMTNRCYNTKLFPENISLSLSHPCLEIIRLSKYLMFPTYRD